MKGYNSYRISASTEFKDIFHIFTMQKTDPEKL